MKNRLSVLILSLAAVSVLSACTGKSVIQTVPDPELPQGTFAETVRGMPAVTVPEEAPEPSTAEFPETTEPPEEAGLTKLSYSIDYHSISPFIRERSSEQTVELADKVIDAFLRGETQIETPEMKRYEQEDVHNLVRIMCPPFTAFCDVEYKARAGSGETSTVFSWKYRKPAEEHQRELEEFEAAVDVYMADLYEEDTDAMRALCIYHAYTAPLTYDYQAMSIETSGLSEDELAYRLSPFWSITHHSGTCYNISEGLMFLFNLAGINAGTVGSYEGTGAHEWVIAELGGKYYYFDATWDINDFENDSLVYFGITEDDRAGWAGGYPAESVEYACTDPVHGLFDLSDNRFEPIHGEKLRNVFRFEADHILQEVYIVTDLESICFPMN